MKGNQQMRLGRVFNLKRMNIAQRVGYFSTIAMLLVLLLLHFPFQGYTITESVVVGRTPGCTRDQDFTPACPGLYGNEFLSFADWRSDAPIFPWFGSVSHVLVLAALIGGLCLVFLTVFDTANSKDQ